MGDTWIVDLTHFLGKDGTITSPKGPALKLAEHMVAIVAMASHPEIIPPPEYQVRCRRRPGRKPCAGMIETYLDPENEDIVWWCRVCNDNGTIRNWKESMWDIRRIGKAH